MTNTRGIRPGKALLCLTATGFLMMGCAPGAWNGTYAIDMAGGARVCMTSPVSPPDGQAVQVPMQVSNEGGWCGIAATRGGAAFDSYLLVTRPEHGRVFAHRVGAVTRIDYIPDPRHVGGDKFAVRMVPGGAVIQGAVNVVK